MSIKTCVTCEHDKKEVSDEPCYSCDVGNECGNWDAKESVKEHDIINHPDHYTKGNYETIDIIEDWDLEYHEGNAIKYISRAKYKNNRVEDLKKAVWYLNRKIGILECME